MNVRSRWPGVRFDSVGQSSPRAAGRRLHRSPDWPTVQTITVELAEIDPAVIDDDTDGFVRVHHERGRLLGCTIVASRAGELIGEATFALTYRHTLSDLSSTIHPYPTQAEVLRKAGDQYRRSLVTARVRGLLERYFRWTR